MHYENSPIQYSEIVSEYFLTFMDMFRCFLGLEIISALGQKKDLFHLSRWQSELTIKANGRHCPVLSNTCENPLWCLFYIIITSHIVILTFVINLKQVAFYCTCKSEFAIQQIVTLAMHQENESLNSLPR